MARNQTRFVPRPSPKSRFFSVFLAFPAFFLELCVQRNLNPSCNFLSKFHIIYTETYRSGHNGADSKSVCGQPHVSSNLTVCAKDNRNLRIAVVFFCYGLIFITVCDVINLISELIYFQHLFFIGRGYKNGRGNLDHLLDIREPMKILILVQFSL